MARPSYRRHRRGGGWWRVLGIVAVCAVAWGAGLVLFASRIPDRVADGETRTDAIVVLTGGSKRLETGLELLARDKADKMFVSGVYRGVDVRKLMALADDPEDRSCCVEVGHSAVNTAGNAAETAEWMNRNAFRSARLVTASYHMPRSLLEFRRALPEATLIPHPVFPDTVMQDAWWLWPGTTALIVGEYNKYLLAWLAHAAGRLVGEAG